MGITYRACAAVLRRMPVDEEARRVFAETLADWRRESGVTRGCVAVVRAVAGVVGREICSLSMSVAWLRVIAWSGGWALLGLALSILVSGYVTVPASAMVAWSITSVVFFLPAAILLAAVSRGRPVPILGLSLTAAVIGALLVGWLLPAASRTVYGPAVNMTFVEPVVTGARSVFLAVWPPLSIDYMRGRDAHELLGLIATGPPGGWLGIQLVSFNAAFVVLCGLMPLLASAVKCPSVWITRAAMTLPLMFVLYRVRITNVVAPDWLLWDFVAPWLPVAIIAAVLMARSVARARALALQ